MKKRALAKFLEVAEKDIEHDGGCSYSFEFDEYLVCTLKEADELAKEYILDSVWAFFPGFLAKHSVIDDLETAESVFRAIAENNRCEGNNDAVRALIKDIEFFVEEAIFADGRGHFLSPYDGEEQGQDGFLIYAQ